MLVLTEIQSCLLQPKVCKVVCFISSVVGFVCYALSSSFNDLFGKWNWWKILLYIGFSFVVSLIVSLAKAWESSTSLRLKAHTTFLTLLTTAVYSFFFDKEVKGKPNAYSLASSAAFAVMSLGLSTLSHFGFEVDLLFFFSELLIIQLMKIKLWLVIVGGSFCYSLVILRSNLNPPPGSQSVWSRDQNYTLIDIDPPENLVTRTAWFSRVSDPSVTVKAEFMRCIDTLKKENGSVIATISKHVSEDLKVKANFIDEDQISVSVLERDDNLLMDVLLEEIVIDLHQSIKQMVLEGFKNECLHVYTNCRREFLKETLSTFGLQFLELNMEDIDKMEKIESWMKALNVAVMLLFPNEKKLCNRLFRGSIASREFALTEVCRELATSLLSTAEAMATWSRFMPKTLQKLIQEFEPEFLNERGQSLRANAVILIELRLSIFEVLKNVSLVPGGGLHRVSRDVIRYINYDCLGGLIHPTKSKPVYIGRTIELLESSLAANSKIYNNPTLANDFIIDNSRFIKLKAKVNGFGNDWFRYTEFQQQLQLYLSRYTEFQQQLQLYLSSSWNKILNFLKLDIHDSEPNIELMKDKLFWFNEHFDETCNVQSAWSVVYKEFRKEIIKSIEEMLLPAYGKFIGRFQEFLGKHAYEHIKYGVVEVKERLNNLFLVDAPDGTRWENTLVCVPSE